MQSPEKVAREEIDERSSYNFRASPSRKEIEGSVD